MPFFDHVFPIHQIKSVDRIFFDVKAIQFIQIMLLPDCNYSKEETLPYCGRMMLHTQTDCVLSHKVSNGVSSAMK